MKSTAVVLFETRELIWQGLRGNFDREPDFLVVGEADSGVEAKRMVAERSPDVVIVDGRLPDADGLGVTRALRA